MVEFVLCSVSCYSCDDVNVFKLFIFLTERQPANADVLSHN